MNALTLTAVLFIAAIGAAGCLAVSAAIIGWFIRDHREDTHTHPIYDWSYLDD